MRTAGNGHSPTNIDHIGPSTALQPTASAIKVDENIEEAEASINSETKLSINDDQAGGEYGKDTNICQNVQAEIAVLRLQPWAEI